MATDRTAAQRDAFALLLRGVNVGGRNRLPMALFRATLEGAGCSDVSTYIQSGNAVFRASAATARASRRKASSMTAGHTGRPVESVLIAGSEFGRIVVDNPFADRDADYRTLHVGFCAEAPPAERVAALDPHRSPPDEFRCIGRAIYLLLPNGAARSKLSNAYFDATLGTTSTFRNWRTVLQLQRMILALD